LQYRKLLFFGKHFATYVGRPLPRPHSKAGFGGETHYDIFSLTTVGKYGKGLA
jgi:hypothetical protein